MILRSDILNIINIQQNTFNNRKYGLIRKLQSHILVDNLRLVIIAGIQSSGKSTLLFQLYKEKFQNALYINFEHPRFYNLDKNDLFKLDEIIEEKGVRILFFDEIQKLTDWNSYVSQKLSEGFQIVITGSDSSILNNEVDHEFAGLNNIKELFPFSYDEFCAFNEIEKSEESTITYLRKGGFPAYLSSNSDEYLNQFFDDILVRGIAVRTGIRDLRSFKRLALHLLSNVGKLITGNQIKNILGIKTTSTVIDYLSFLESAYLFFYVPKFSYSVSKQMINPRKVYAVDTGLVTANSTLFEDSTEQLLENLVFLHLRKQISELYYHSEKFNCDFVVMNKNRVEKVIQVCDELKQDNLEDELNGVFEAMDFFELDEGTIVTMNQTDRFERNGRVVNVIPFYLFV
ncbi:MAG: ATP-binding protein [Draconibacterium sp.]|nr:ATP-binding protein [Draconibacterium sp.]